MSEPTAFYSIDKSREIMGRIRDIRKSLTSGQQEKMNLMHELARLKDEFPINKLQGGSSPDVSTLSIPNLQERLEAASQTDLSGDVRKTISEIFHYIALLFHFIWNCEFFVKSEILIVWLIYAALNPYRELDRGAQ